MAETCNGLRENSPLLNNFNKILFFCHLWRSQWNQTHLPKTERERERERAERERDGWIHLIKYKFLDSGIRSTQLHSLLFGACPDRDFGENLRLLLGSLWVLEETQILKFEASLDSVKFFDVLVKKPSSRCGSSLDFEGFSSFFSGENTDCEYRDFWIPRLKFGSCPKEDFGDLWGMAGVQEQLEIKFRLHDGSDIGPKMYPAATSIATLKESILAEWPKENENAPKTVNDVKLINGGKILENNQTLGECKSPICDLSEGITTMHVVVRPPSEKGTGTEKKTPNTPKETKCGCIIL